MEAFCDAAGGLVVARVILLLKKTNKQINSAVLQHVVHRFHCAVQLLTMEVCRSVCI